MTTAETGFDDVGCVVVVGFGLLEDRVARDIVGIGVRCFVGVEANELFDLAAERIVFVFGERFAAGWVFFDDVACFVVPSVVGQAVADGAGRDVDGVAFGLVDAAEVVVFGFATSDQVAG